MSITRRRLWFSPRRCPRHNLPIVTVQGSKETYLSSHNPIDTGEPANVRRTSLNNVKFSSFVWTPCLFFYLFVLRASTVATLCLSASLVNAVWKIRKTKMFGAMFVLFCHTKIMYTVSGKKRIQFSLRT